MNEKIHLNDNLVICWLRNYYFQRSHIRCYFSGV